MTRVTSHPPPLARQPISCYYCACDLSYFDVVLCLSSSQISPDPLSARSLRLLGFPKSPPLKNPRSTTAIAPNIFVTPLHIILLSCLGCPPRPKRRNSWAHLLLLRLALSYVVSLLCLSKALSQLSHTFTDFLLEV